MRIAVIGAQGVGKSTLVDTIKAYWPAYLSPEKTYRDLIKEKNLTINESGTMESQQVIRDYLVDIALDNAGKDKTIHDRCVLDNLAYTFWLVEHNKLGDDEKAITDFVTTSIILAKESLKFYDVVFWLPLNPNIPLEESENRSQSESYREEMDNIFFGIHENYKKNAGLIFDKENQPAFIVLEGELDQKIDTIKQYINEDGELIETNSSVLGDLEAVYDEAVLRKQLKV
jgi:thymidylate kinase